MRRFIAGAVLALAALPAFAATATVLLTVESVLSPAWVERANGRREPLIVGMSINNGEKVHTGDAGRATMRLAEGSTVKVGEAAMLAVDDLAHKGGSGGIVSATLNAVRGAFRFTTGVLQKTAGQRDVRIKVNAITAGIRGTDVWGRSESERDIVCLLEGNITVSHGAARFQMTEPNSFYIVPRTGQAAPPSSVSPQQVKEWSDETEIFPNMGGTRVGGTAYVRVASAPDEAAGNTLRDKLRESGYPATLAVGGTGYEVRIDSLADSTEAGVLAEKLRRIGFREAQAEAR